jgi:hypothetical protein
MQHLLHFFPAVGRAYVWLLAKYLMLVPAYVFACLCIFQVVLWQQIIAMYFSKTYMHYCASPVYGYISVPERAAKNILVCSALHSAPVHYAFVKGE